MMTGIKKKESKKILAEIERYMGAQHMVSVGSHIIAGVSGGADSMCMLLVLLALQETFGYTLSVVHVEHGIRGADSRKDAAFVRQFCEEKGIACTVYHYKVPEYAKEHGMGEEEAGRFLRYASFDAEKEKYPGREVKIAVAHNLNDNAETMLFHLARGSGVRGLCGIAPVRENIIRPLLAVSRQEIESYLSETGQGFCMDATNLSGLYSRNRIRMDALPALERANCRCIWHMFQTAEDMRELAEYLKKQTEKELEVCSTDLEDGSGIYIKKELFDQAEPVLQKEMLYQIVVKLAGSCKNIAGVHIRQMSELFERQNGRKIQLPYGIVAQRVYGGIELRPELTEEKNAKAEQKPEFSRKENWQNAHVRDVEGMQERFSFRLFEKKFLTEPQISEKKYTKWFDYDKIKSGLCIRHRMPGDYLAINDAGARQKLKNYLVNEKIPAKEREIIPLLADGAHIMWIVGHRISSYYKVEKHTKRVLEVTFYG